MGRPRKPTALKLMTGNPGKRKLPEERAVPQTAPVKPAWLGVSGSAVWDELAPDRIAIGLLTNLTGEAFAQLCTLLGLFRRSPLKLTGSQLTHMRVEMGNFGFDPSSLAKHGIATPTTARDEHPAERYFT